MGTIYDNNHCWYNAAQVSNISMAVRLELAYIMGVLLITNIMLLPFSTLLSILRLRGYSNYNAGSYYGIMASNVTNEYE